MCCLQIQDDDMPNLEKPDMGKKLMDRSDDNGVPAEELCVKTNHSDATPALDKEVALLSLNDLLLYLSFWNSYLWTLKPFFRSRF